MKTHQEFNFTGKRGGSVATVTRGRGVKKPKSASVHELCGTKSRAKGIAPPTPEGQVLKKLPAPPKQLTSQEAIEHWQDVGPDLVDDGKLTRTNLRTFALMCVTWGEIVDQFARISTARDRIFSGKKPRTTAGIYVERDLRLNKQAALNVSLITQYRQMVNDFGLTPVGAAFLASKGAGAPAGAREPDPADEFETNKRRKTA